MASHLDFEMGFAGGGRSSRRKDTDPMRILLMGDFSGRANRGIQNAGDLAGRPTPMVDVDNFESLIDRYAPQLRFRMGEDDGPLVTLEFRELDDFHPDHLFRKLDLFQALRDLRARLKHPDSFAQAAAELRTEAGLGAAPQKPEDAAGEAPAAAANPEDDMFKRLLGRESSSPAAQPAVVAAGIDGFIRSMVAAHVVPDIAPEQGAYLASVDDTLSEQMRAVLHHPHFQALEAAWRSVFRVVTGVETDEELKIYLLDVTKQELVDDVVACGGNLSASGLHKLLVERGEMSPDRETWSVIAADFAFGADAGDLGLLAALGAVASRAGGPLLAAAGVDPGSLQGPAAQDWQTLRKSGVARWLGLASPRVMLREPYGAATESIDSFAFEEIPVLPGDHAAYLWGSPAFACATLLAQSFRSSGWAMEPGDELDIEDLPFITYLDENGEKAMKPCAEDWISESRGEALLAEGVMPLMSYRNRDMVRVFRMQSLADPAAPLAGPWD